MVIYGGIGLLSDTGYDAKHEQCLRATLGLLQLPGGSVGSCGVWGCAVGCLGGAAWPRLCSACRRSEDPALQLLPEAAHLPPVHRPCPARQPGGGHRLVSASDATGLPGACGGDSGCGAYSGCEDAQGGLSSLCFNWYCHKLAGLEGFAPCSNPMDAGVRWPCTAKRWWENSG